MCLIQSYLAPTAIWLSAPDLFPTEWRAQFFFVTFPCLASSAKNATNAVNTRFFAVAGSMQYHAFSTANFHLKYFPLIAPVTRF